jgi:hypothetical protein
MPMKDHLLFSSVFLLIKLFFLKEKFGYHELVKRTLMKDGWTITHDPLTLSFGKKNIYVDLGAEQLLAAEKEERRIAVEIKSFLSDSEIDDLEKAVGQYILYQNLLVDKDPERVLYLAISKEAYEGIFSESFINSFLKKQNIHLIIFDKVKEVILRWIQ